MLTEDGLQKIGQKSEQVNEQVNKLKNNYWIRKKIAIGLVKEFYDAIE